MSDVATYELHGNVGVIRVNNPPVNALSHAVREAIFNSLETAQNDDSQAVVLICEGRTFIAGADIKEFGKPIKEPGLSAVLAKIESLTKPVIAAIHGTALGGGFETALACQYRCAVSSGKIGLPEVKLGLLPGAGGTQRTPRLAGAEAALDFIYSGKPVSASKALSLGLIDHIVDGDDLLAGAIAYAEHLITEQAPLRKVRDITIDPATVPVDLFDNYRAKIAKKTRGLISPENIIKCIEAAVNMPFDEGLAYERELFIECMNSPQSAALRHAFFAERQTSKIPDVPKDTPTRPIKKAGIIGGGLMGGGIAMNFANVGIPVTLLEISEEALERGLGTVRKNYNRTAKKGRITEAQVEERMALIQGTTNYDDLANVDLVIEAVFENPDIKKEVFAKLDTVIKPGAILASNTSYQDIDAIAAVTNRPEDVIGLHFFSPANVMKLLEVVRGEKTSKDVIATAMRLTKTIDKIPVLARVCYGFIGNRMFNVYRRSANMLLLEGATPEQIDSVAYEWGMAMGPVAVSDLTGIDVGAMARQARGVSAFEQQAYRPSDLMYELGRYGQKTGSGFYNYDPDTRARSNDPEVVELIKAEAEKMGITQRTFTDQEIIERLLFALINEGARILEEGIALRPSDIDITYLYGYGFPAYRGGPMFHADTLGTKYIVERITEFGQGFGAEDWQPAPLLVKLAEEDKTFAEWAQGES